MYLIDSFAFMLTLLMFVEKRVSNQRWLVRTTISVLIVVKLVHAVYGIGHYVNLLTRVFSATSKHNAWDIARVAQKVDTF